MPAALPVSALVKFQTLLRTLFQFENADLDFGIYRVLNFKRAEIDAFIGERLPLIVDDAFQAYTSGDRAALDTDIAAEAQTIRQSFGGDAFDASGQLAAAFQTTPLGKKYLGFLERRAGMAVSDELTASVYNDLYTFFNRYYEDGDFISKRRRGRDETYAIPYNGEEVMLTWANRDQYYIKTDERLAAYGFYIKPHHVVFEVRAAENQHNNNKGKSRFYVLAASDSVAYDAETKTLTVAFEHRALTEAETIEFGTKSPQEKINAQTESTVLASVSDAGLKALLAMTPSTDATGRSVILRHLSQYTRKNTTDFFIHKDLKTFLRRELDHFIKNDALLLDELISGTAESLDVQVRRARVLRDVAYALIDFLAQVEDFQKRLFEKKKFVVRTDYVFTLDRIPEALHETVYANAAQVQEWRDLYGYAGSGERGAGSGERGAGSGERGAGSGERGAGSGERGAGSGLDQGSLSLETIQVAPSRRFPVDTRHFPDTFKWQILSEINDLDANTDGVLFNSENFQALRIMLEKYSEQINGVYVDPPYNTFATEILYKNGYKHSSWLSLMWDRLHLVQSMLMNNGNLCITIDDYEIHGLMALLEQIFGEENVLATVLIRNNPSGRSTVKGFAINHEYGIFCSKSSENVNVGRLPHSDEQAKRYDAEDDEGRKYEWENFRKSSAASDRSDRPKQFYPIYYDTISKTLRLPSLEWENQNDRWKAVDQLTVREVAILPLQALREKVWRYGIARTQKYLSTFTVKERDGQYEIYTPKYFNSDGSLPRTWWDKAAYSARDNGTRAIVDLFGANKVFDFPKSAHAVEDCLRVLTNDDEALIMDMFGGSGTTAHAVINLNREDDGNRKYILVEMGEHFDTVLLRRIKKVVYCPDWKDGKPAGGESISQIVKYHTLEQYEDTLNNLEVKQQAQAAQQAADLFGDDYLLRYMLEFETRGSASLLNLSALTEPFSYTLNIKQGDEIKPHTVDLVETFNYLLGLSVKKMRAYENDGRAYRAVSGTKDNRRMVVVWRDAKDLAESADALASDKAFIAQTVVPDLLGENIAPDRLFVNSPCAVPGVEAVEPEFKRLMFGEAF